MEFGDIGIQRVTTEQMKTSLEERQNMGIDPFKRGYAQGQYDKEAVKLCFQVLRRLSKFRTIPIPYTGLLN